MQKASLFYLLIVIPLFSFGFPKNSPEAQNRISHALHGGNPFWTAGHNTGNIVPPVVNITVTPESCPGSCDGSATAVITGGNPPFAVQWLDGLGNPIAGATGNTLSGLCPGNYSVRVTEIGGGGVVTAYSENFDAGAPAWTLNVATGVNAAQRNEWEVNDTEGGVAPPGCGVGNNGDGTLHITCTSLFCGTFITGAVYNATQNSNLRAESPAINTVGLTNLTLSFDFISNGQGLIDNASVLYNDGTGWQVLNPSIKAPVCGSGQGQWTAFTATLPASCENIPNLRIGFNWTNNADNVGTDPSIAVNNVLVQTPAAALDTVIVATTVAPGASPTVSIAPAGPIAVCNGATQTLTASGANTYVWSNGANTAAITVATAGTYIVTGTDANGCTASASVLVTVGNAPTANAGLDGQICAAGSFTLLGTGTGGTPPYTFAWNNGAGNIQSPVVSPAATTTYTLTLTDANGCTATDAVTVSVFAATISPNATICPGGNTQLLVTGTGIFNIAWSPGTGLNNTTITNPVASPATTTTYTATVLQAGGNLITNGNFSQGNVGFNTNYALGVGGPFGPLSNEGTYAITTNPNAVHNGFAPCVDHTTGNGNMMVVNGAGFPGVNIWCQTVNVLPNTSYAFSTWAASAVAGSPAILQFFINGVPLGGTFNAPNVTCQWQQFFQVWNSGANNTAQICIVNQNTQTGGNDFALDDISFSPVCQSTVQVTVNVTNLLPQASNSGPSCVGDTVQLSVTANGGLSFNWSGPGGFTASGTPVSIPNAQPANVGAYTVTVTGAGGCTATASTGVFVSANPTANAGANQAICLGANANLLATAAGGQAPYTFAWDNGLGNGAGQTVSPANTTTYTVTATGTNGCSGSASTVVTVNQQTATLSGDSTLCLGDSAQLAAFGVPAPQSYLWSNNATSPTITVGQAGTYTVTLTGATGCTASVAINVTVTSVPISIAVPATLTCAVNTVTIDASATPAGPNTVFGWSGPGLIAGANTPTPSANQAGNYVLVVTDTLTGCSNTDTATVLLDNAPPASVLDSVQDALCAGSCNAQIFLGAPLGANYSYAWSGGLPSVEDPSGVCSGAYSVTITDNANGCTATIPNIVVLATQPVVPNLDNTPDAACAGQCDGAINVTIFGGNAPFAYNWNFPFGNVEDPTNVCAGNYAMTVTDANGCTASLSGITIAEPAPLVLNIDSLANTSCNGTCDGYVSLSASGGVAPYGFVWNNGQVGPLLNNLCAGLFAVTATDINGCTATDFPQIAEPAPLAAAAQVTPVSCFGGNDGALDLTISGGQTPYSFAWATGQTDEDLAGLSVGAYDLILTDANGCTFSTIVTITEPQPLLTSIQTSAVLCNANSDGTVNLSVSGGTGPFAFLWNTGPISEDLAGVPIGTYAVTVTDANGCTVSDSASVSGPPTLLANVLGSTAASCSYSCDGNATVLGNGGTPYPFGYNYTWSNGQTAPSALGLCPGTYTATVTDLNGCTATASVTVSAPTAVTATVQTTPLSCYSSTDGTATATASGGVPGYNYTWSNGNVGPFQVGLPRGNVSVTVTDANGCTATAFSFIGSPNPLFGNPSITDATCSDLSNGVIALNPFGGTAPYQYLWSNGNTTAVNVGLAAGTFFTVTLTDANGCDTVLTALAVGEPLPLQAQAIQIDDALCAGQASGTGTVNVFGGTAAFVYEWDNGETADTAVALLAGVHVVSVTDANGCSTTDTLLVEEPTAVVSEYVVTDPVCFGEETGAIAIDTIFGGTGPYALSLDGETYFPNIGAGYQFDGLPAGNYTLFVQDLNGCGDTTELSVLQPDEFIFTIGTDTTIQLGDSVVIAGFAQSNVDGIVWSWAPPTGLSCTDCLTPLAQPQSTTLYTLTWADSNGCTGLDEITITVIPERRVFIPNAFSPNDDGLNDAFYVYGGTGVARISTFAIYDRWGEQLFSASDILPNDPQTGWDGTFKGRKMMLGTYIYFTEIVFVDGKTIAYKGDVLLIR